MNGRKSWTLFLVISTVALFSLGCPVEVPEDDSDTGDQNPADTSSDSNGGEGDTGDTGSKNDTDEPEDTASKDSGDTGKNDASSECTLDQPFKLAGSHQLHPLTQQFDQDATLEDTWLKFTSIFRLSTDGAMAKPLQHKKEDGSCADARIAIQEKTGSKEWLFEQMDVFPVNPDGGALLSLAEDTSESGKDEFLLSISPVATFDTLDKESELTTAATFAVTQDLIAGISQSTSKSKQELLEKGLFLGMVLDQENNPVSGYKVGPLNPDTGKVSPLDKTIYPVGDFSDAQTGANGGSTSANGVFLIPDPATGPYAGTTGTDQVETTIVGGGAGEQAVYVMMLRVQGGGN